ncbi:leucyl aminopeptidase [Nakamurella aerolata]|uniref:Probable cytosol aminopeptidase n=1 Tax=Nakamurella aerolata TaxID=1656892 RepID=A0A849AC35_9ACTN|nr:leucyl aminopeptidase [Nakamurella aerolata]NNG37156.1 leucyl aminopeptidase [Nakamurella aerolata]
MARQSAAPRSVSSGSKPSASGRSASSRSASHRGTSTRNTSAGGTGATSSASTASASGAKPKRANTKTPAATAAAPARRRRASAARAAGTGAGTAASTAPPQFSLTTADPGKVKADALIVGLHTGAEEHAGAVLPFEPEPQSPWAQVQRAAELAGISGALGEVATVPGTDLVAADRLVLVGLGEIYRLDAERVRKAAGNAARAVAGLGEVATTLSAIDLAATVEGLALGGYVFAGYKQPSKPPVRSVKLLVPSADKAAKEVLRRAVVTAEAVLLARDLINTPPNDLPPAAFAERAAQAGAAAGLTVEVLDEKALQQKGFGGILAVGAGSARPPRLLRLSYRPARPAAKIALVGKGVTYDSGGLSLKPMPGMVEMTSDMSGAAAVVAATIGAAALGLPVAVTATVPLAENLPSGSAYRPADVITHYAGKGKQGKTSHILNTDAEGRIILADAIVRAAEDNPDYLLETATLTGAQVVALGNRTMGVMGTDELRDRVAELARQTGEGGWAMPMPEELREGLQSYLADIQNVGAGREGGMLTAAHYLAAFVPDELPWAHLDVAGPAFHPGAPYGYTTKGGTGVPVRTLLATMEDLADA